MILFGVFCGYLGILISVAMVSRIAKAFQDYFGNVVVQKFGAHFYRWIETCIKLPFQEFEDQRSGETLAFSQKCGQIQRNLLSFHQYFIRLMVGVVFVSVYSFTYTGSIMPVYLVELFLLSLLTGFLSKRIKSHTKNHCKRNQCPAGTTTESLRNIELVKSLGLTDQEVKGLNNNTYKIFGLELKKVKSIRS